MIMLNYPLNIVFCIPGNQFSGLWLDCWTNLTQWCTDKGIQWSLNRKEGCNLYHVRSSLLGADLTRGRNQTPWGGLRDYSHVCFIDSDMVFFPHHLERLLNWDKEFVSGIYKMADGMRYATVLKRDDELLRSRGTYNFLTDQDLPGLPPGVTEVSYTGLGFALIKRSALDQFDDYPWFGPEFIEIDNVREVCGEDVSFCWKLKRKGFPIWIDPKVNLGHLKLQQVRSG